MTLREAQIDDRHEHIDARREYGASAWMDGGALGTIRIASRAAPMSWGRPVALVPVQRDAGRLVWIGRLHAAACTKWLALENLHEAMRSLRSLSAIANLASGRCADLIEGEPTGRERKGSDSFGTMSAAEIERKLSDLKGKIALLIDSPAGV